MPIPRWMRTAMYATAALNAVGAIIFLPGMSALRAITGLPDSNEPLYMVMTGMFIFIFGLAYLAVAVTARADRLLVALSALGKLSFAAILTGFALSGSLPCRTPFIAVPDVVFAVIFIVWLRQSASVRPA